MNKVETKQEDVNNNIKNVGIFFWISSAIISLQAFLFDPYFLFDAAIVATMAYYMHSRKSINALFFAIVYYFFNSTVLMLSDLEYSPFSYVIRLFILFWMISTAYRAYKSKYNSSGLVLEN